MAVLRNFAEKGRYTSPAIFAHNLALNIWALPEVRNLDESTGGYRCAGSLRQAIHTKREDIPGRLPHGNPVAGSDSLLLAKTLKRCGDCALQRVRVETTNRGRRGRAYRARATTA
jgi:hypothetical protein